MTVSVAVRNTVGGIYQLHKRVLRWEAMPQDDDREVSGYQVIAYSTLEGDYRSLEDDPWAFPLTDDEMLNVDYAVVGIHFADGVVEYRTFSDGPYDDRADLEDDIREWLDNGTP